MLLFLPSITDALSLENAIHLDHWMSYNFIFSSSFPKVFSAVAWLQTAKSRNAVVTCPMDESMYLKRAIIKTENKIKVIIVTNNH